MDGLPPENPAIAFQIDAPDKPMWVRQVQIVTEGHIHGLSFYADAAHGAQARKLADAIVATVTMPRSEVPVALHTEDDQRRFRLGQAIGRMLVPAVGLLGVLIYVLSRMRKKGAP